MIRGDSGEEINHFSVVKFLGFGSFWRSWNSILRQFLMS